MILEFIFLLVGKKKNSKDILKYIYGGEEWNGYLEFQFYEKVDVNETKVCAFLDRMSSNSKSHDHCTWRIPNYK